MLQLLSFGKQCDSRTDSTDNKSDSPYPALYSQLVSPRSEIMDPESGFYEMNNSVWQKDINKSDTKEICEFLCIAEEDTDDSGCHCTDSNHGNDSCLDKSFREEDISFQTDLDCDDQQLDAKTMEDLENYSPYETQHIATIPEQKYSHSQGHTQGRTPNEEVSSEESECESSHEDNAITETDTHQRPGEQTRNKATVSLTVIADTDTDSQYSDVDQESSENSDDEECPNIEEYPENKDSQVNVSRTLMPDNVNDNGDDLSSEGGWVSDGNIKSQARDSDSGSDVEMFDLFGENNRDNYHYSTEDEDQESMRIVTSSVRNPPLPKREYQNKVYCYPSKKRSSYPTIKPVQQKQRSRRKKKNVDNFYDSFNWHEEADTYAMIAASNGAPSVKRGRYAFPRSSIDDISDIVEIWETDFQVNKTIIPRMSLWESLGLVPDRARDSEDYDLYVMYKNLYDKWRQCHASKEQWYRKYGFSSLDNVLHLRKRHFKLYPHECEPIEGLQERLEMFELYHDSLAMSIAEKNVDICYPKSPKYPGSFATAVASGSQIKHSAKSSIK